MTHDQEEALAISDRIAVMQGGRVLQLGTPEEIYDRPRHAFVSAFVGKANRLAGVVVARQDGVAVCEIRGGARVLVAGETTPPVGAPIEFAVRPEKILIGAAASTPSTNHVEGKVRTRIYFGMFTELRVQLPSGDDLTVVRQNTRRAGAEPEPEPGDTVSLSWSADAAHVLG